MSRRQNSSEFINSSPTNHVGEHSDIFSDSCGKNTAFGVSLIPGTGKLLEFANKKCEDCACGNDCSDKNNIVSCLCNNKFCPRSYSGCVVVDNCCKFAAFKKVNFIDGDLIITDGSMDDHFFTACNGVTLSLTEAIDIFPNLLGINGNLYIIGTIYSKISGFSKLRWVTGSIIIANNQNLGCIPSFESLLNIGGIICGGNDGCPCKSDNDSEHNCLNVNCCGCINNNAIPVINPLRYCSSFLAIAYNPCLKKISGFEALRQVNDGIFIIDNAKLVSIAGFIHLYRTDRVVIRGNAFLNKIIGFCYIDTLNVGLFILENNCNSGYDLVLGAFLSLETAGKIIIINNNGLKSIKLDSLVTVCGDFIISHNKNLFELYSNVHYIGGLYIQNNAIINLKFPHLKEINNRFILAKEKLAIFDTFDELRRVGKIFIVTENDHLVEFKGANKLKYIGDDTVAYTPPVIHCSDDCHSPASKNTISWILSIDNNNNEGDCLCPNIIIAIPLCDSTNRGIPDVRSYDNCENQYKCSLSEDFFTSLCNKNANNPLCPVLPDHVSASIIFHGNSVLKAISGFNNLRHIKSNLYIVGNKLLHTINSFGHLAFALDVWFRNNANLKYVIGFNSLLAVRDFVILDALLNEFNGLASLEFAQRIAIETKSIKSFNNNKLIPTTCGYVTYVKFDCEC